MTGAFFKIIIFHFFTAILDLKKKKAIYLGFFYIPAPIFFLFLILSKNAPVIVRIMSLSTFAEKMKLLSQVVFEFNWQFCVNEN